MKEQWIREGFSNYYVVKKEQKLTYEKNILCYHTIECLLPCEFRIEDEEEYYYFETGIYTRLRDKIDILDPKLFFAYLIEVLEEVESYLLDLDHLRLEVEFLFLNKENKPVLCYLPEYEKNIFDQLRDFLEECIETSVGNDKKKVRFYYEFHSFIVKEKPNMEQMKEYLEIHPKKEQAQIEKIEEQPDLEEEEWQDQQKEIEIKEKNRNFNRILKIGCIIVCMLGICASIYFMSCIFKYGFYYLFLIGSMVSWIGTGFGVYGFCKLWRKDLKKEQNVDYDQEKEDHTILLDDKTTLLEDEDDKTVLLMEEPIGKLIPCNRELKEIEITDNEFIIGSSMEGTDFLLEGTGISRRHIRFYQKEQIIYCEDLHSTNGVKVNGKKIKTTALRDGDRIKIGLEEFIFHEV